MIANVTGTWSVFFFTSITQTQLTMKTAIYFLAENGLTEYDQCEGYILKVEDMVELLNEFAEEYADLKCKDFTDYLSARFVPTTQKDNIQYWKQKNYCGKLRFTTDEVYRIYNAEPS